MSDKNLPRGAACKVGEGATGPAATPVVVGTPAGGARTVQTPKSAPGGLVRESATPIVEHRALTASPPPIAQQPEGGVTVYE